MKKVKIGVFGAGRGMTMVHQILDRTDAELVAICDKFQPSLDRCKSTAEKAGLTNVGYYTEFEDFIRHEDMDAVVLANYAYQHAPYAIRLLNSGFHVMSECLTCANMKEAVELIEAVERNPHLVYSYAENYCFTEVRREMKRRYENGDIGELMYAEGEYAHDCSEAWPNLTRGEKDHWRNMNNSAFYCTHSTGPIIYMTGLRPVKVTGFETQCGEYYWKLGAPWGTTSVIMITLENGAIFKSMQGGVKRVSPTNYEICGTRGAMYAEEDGSVSIYYEGENVGNGCGKYETYTPDPVISEATTSGHGGSDFYTTHYFIKAIQGDEDARKAIIDVYTAVDMCLPGILAFRSIKNGNSSIDVPNLRNKEERDAYRNDTFCSFPDVAGDMYAPSNAKMGTKGVPCNANGVETPPDSVYEEVRRRFLAGEPG